MPRPRADRLAQIRCSLVRIQCGLIGGGPGMVEPGGARQIANRRSHPPPAASTGSESPGSTRRLTAPRDAAPALLEQVSSQLAGERPMPVAAWYAWM